MRPYPIELPRRAIAASALALSLFLLLMLVIGLEPARKVDLQAATTADITLGPLVEPRFAPVALLWSPELSLLYGAIATALLWRRGWGLRSSAPMTFLLLVPVEALLKYTLHRPPMPIGLRPWPPYPWVNPSFGTGDGGYYLSGSALRTAFFCLLLGILLWKRGRGMARLASVVVLAAPLLFGLIRVYGGYHWLTAELSGQLLGAALAIPVAAWLALPVIHPGSPTGIRKR